MASDLATFPVDLNPLYPVLYTHITAPVKTVQMLQLADRILTENVDIKGVYVIRDAASSALLYTIVRKATMQTEETVRVIDKGLVPKSA